MASFEIAFARTEKWEGANIWTKDPNDPGGETWSGISRRANPNWKGWAIIDKILSKFNKMKIVSKELTDLKRELYLNNYWNPLRLTEIDNQRLANQVYDDAVNTGTPTARGKLQDMFHFPRNASISDDLILKANYQYYVYDSVDPIVGHCLFFLQLCYR